MNSDAPPSGSVPPSLGAFSQAEAATATDEAAALTSELLVFDVGDERFGIRVSDVTSVVPFRVPAPVPHAVGAILGVLQDQGVIITVVANPLGRDAPNDATRIVVCTTSRGLIGIPATGTTHLGTVAIRREVAVGEPVATEFGTLVYLDAPFVVDNCCG